jgi:trans-2,3-dihydro-3-hydroxyanthranilate isomerase
MRGSGRRTPGVLPRVSVPEDPATGSAALGLGVWLVGRAGCRRRHLVVHGAPGHRDAPAVLLECTVTAAGGAATTATVSGHVIPIARGEIAVPPFLG